MNKAASRQCPPGTLFYRMRSGDNLYRLALRYKTTVQAILSANPNISPYILPIGQIICIPSAAPPSATCPEGSGMYTIRQGDTFSQVVQRFNTTVEALTEINPDLNPNSLSVGQRICIPIPQAMYISQIYNVGFMYPGSWRRIEDTKYEGAEGFLHISAISSDKPIDKVYKNEVSNNSNLYGTNPEISKLKVQEHEACLIMPSEDQRPEKKGQAALIVKYPKPIEISGQTHNYFILRSDKAHIKRIADTLRFLTF